MGFNLSKIRARMHKSMAEAERNRASQQVVGAPQQAIEKENVFTSQKGTPVVATDETSGAQLSGGMQEGLLGNVRKTLFSGGVSAGGIFSYGKRQNKLFS